MIIIDFIDMLSRADKLAIMEELEIALEPDKAKPQVGQLSDLGLDRTYKTQTGTIFVRNIHQKMSQLSRYRIFYE